MVDYERPFKIAKCSSHEHYRDWSSLPLDILRDISSRLMIFDCYSFANVCTSWRSAKAPLSPQMPFIFLRKNYFTPKPFCKLLSITDNLSINVHMPILGRNVCVGSQYGWLILADNTVGVISLYNPFSQQVIKLPSHADIVTWFFTIKNTPPLSESDYISRWFSFRKVVLSCPPISPTGRSRGRFLAAAALSDGGDFMYKGVGDCSWKWLSIRSFQDITSWRGKFVGVTWEGEVHKIDLDGPQPKMEYMGFGSDNTTLDKYNKHLVNLDDNLLQVWWYIDSENTITVKVMQPAFDPLTGIPVDDLWIPINDLCGHSLFLGTSNSFSLSCQRFPGLKDNLIYFIKDKWGHEDYNDDLKRVGVFNMRNGTYEICTLPNSPFPQSTSTFWYAPPMFELQKFSF